VAPRTIQIYDWVLGDYLEPPSQVTYRRDMRVVTIITEICNSSWYMELVAQIVSHMETTRLNQISSDKT
jgi:hypothetical protein